jgi:hypothetical protein
MFNAWCKPAKYCQLFSLLCGKTISWHCAGDSKKEKDFDLPSSDLMPILAVTKV